MNGARLMLMGALITGAVATCNAQEPAPSTYAIEGVSAVATFSATLSVTRTSVDRASVELVLAGAPGARSAALVRGDEDVFVGTTVTGERFALRLTPGVSGVIEVGGALHVVRVTAGKLPSVAIPLQACEPRDRAPYEGTVTFGLFGPDLTGFEERWLDLLGAYLQLPLVPGWKKESRSRRREGSSVDQAWRVWRNDEQGLLAFVVLVSGPTAAAMVRGTLRVSADRSDEIVSVLERLVDRLTIDPGADGR